MITIPEYSVTKISLINKGFHADDYKNTLTEPGEKYSLGKKQTQKKADACVVTSSSILGDQFNYCYAQKFNIDKKPAEMVGQSLFNACIDTTIAHLTQASKNSDYTRCSTTLCYLQDGELISLQVGNSRALLITVNNNNSIKARFITPLHSNRSLGYMEAYLPSRFNLKKPHSFEPEVTTMDLNFKERNFLLMASGNLFNDLSKDFIKNTFVKGLKNQWTLQRICEELQTFASNFGNSESKATMLIPLSKKSSGTLYGLCAGEFGDQAAKFAMDSLPKNFMATLTTSPVKFNGLKITLPKKLGDAFETSPLTDKEKENKLNGMNGLKKQ